MKTFPCNIEVLGKIGPFKYGGEVFPVCFTQFPVLPDPMNSGDDGHGDRSLHRQT